MPIVRAGLVGMFCFAGATPLTAQAPRQVDGADRLFDRFVEDAGVVPSGWLEGAVVFESYAPGERYGLGTVVGFNAGQDFEFGFSFGGLRSEPDDGPSETGLSDVGAWGKGKIIDGTSVFVVGGALTLPTGDEEKGLGSGEVDVEAFAAFRKSWAVLTLSANGGLRLNQDTEIPRQNGGFPAPDGDSTEGEVSALAGLGLIFPLGERWTFITELSGETRRYRGQDSDVRFTPGLTWRRGRALLRGAVTAGLTDGAPNLAVQLGATLLF